MDNQLESLYHFSQKHASFRLYDQYKADLDRGATPDEHWSLGRRSSPLFSAILDGDAELTRLLLEHGADPLTTSNAGWTPTHVAVVEHQSTLLSTMLARIGTTSLIFTSTEARDEASVDDTNLASHLLAHGVRGTNGRHVALFVDLLNDMIGDLEVAPSSGNAYCKILSDHVENALTKHSRGVPATAWSRELCTDCERFEDRDAPDIFKIFKHSPDHASLVQSASAGCNVCQYLVYVLRDHWCLLHQVDRKC